MFQFSFSASKPFRPQLWKVNGVCSGRLLNHQRPQPTVQEQCGMRMEHQPAADRIPETSFESAAAVADRRLQESVHRALALTPYRVLSRAAVGVFDGQVKLTGHVPSYYAKQIATLAVLGVSGVTGLCNDLTVSPR
jgi:osmotically-inducible protein OsmY